MKQSSFKSGYEAAAKGIMFDTINENFIAGYAYFKFFEKTQGRNRNKAQSKKYHKQQDRKQVDLFIKGS